MQVRRNAAVSGRGRAAYACGGGCHGALSKPPLIMVRLSYRALVASCCTVPTVLHRPCGVGAALLCRSIGGYPWARPLSKFLLPTRGNPCWDLRVGLFPCGYPLAPTPAHTGKFAQPVGSSFCDTQIGSHLSDACWSVGQNHAFHRPFAPVFDTGFRSPWLQRGTAA